MKFSVRHISHSDLLGGASIAAFRLHHGLIKAHIDSQMFVLVKSSEYEHVAAYNYQATTTQRILRKLKQLRLEHINNKNQSRRELKTTFTDDRSNLGKHLIRQIPLSNVIHLHWTAGMIDYKILCRHFESRSILVWTLHDLVHITGGCHYPYDCDKYTDHCGCCPQLNSTMQNDWSYQIFKRKNAAFKLIANQAIFIAPSKWAKKIACQSALLNDIEVHHIPYAIDISEYMILNRSELRKKYQINENDVTLLFIAGNIQEQRKGFVDYLAAINQLCFEQPGTSLTALIVGKNLPENLKSSCLIKHVDYVSDKQQLNDIYNLADATVLPTIADTGPQTALESIACGTPIIGYNTGIIADVLEYPDMGILCKDNNILSLVDALKLFVNSANNFKPDQIRERATKYFDLSEAVVRHQELYMELLSKKRI